MAAPESLSYQDSPTTLEGELVELLRSLRLSSRQSRALANRLGWDGDGGTTLHDAGAAHGYTRERVRQLEARVRRIGRGGPARLPLLEAAAEVIAGCAPDTRAHAADELWASGLASEPFDPFGVATALAVVGRPTPFELADELVTRSETTHPARVALASARRLAAKNGVARVTEVAFELGLEPDRARRILATVSEVEWLDSRRSYAAVAVPKLARRIELVLRKVLAVSPVSSYADIDDAMRRSFRPVRLPLAILVERCLMLGWVETDRRGALRATQVLEPTVELTPVERELIASFDGPDEVLSFSEAVIRGTRRGLNRNTIAGYLGHSPVIRSVGRGRFMIRSSR